MTHPLFSAEISIFSPEINNFSYVFNVFKGCFNKHGCNFVEVSKIGYSRSS